MSGRNTLGEYVTMRPKAASRTAAGGSADVVRESPPRVGEGERFVVRERRAGERCARAPSAIGQPMAEMAVGTIS